MSESLSFTHEVPVRVEDFVDCQHSRATFARRAMGAKDAARFDDELNALLSPFAKDGVLYYEMRSDLVLGRPRRSPTAMA